MPPLRLILHLRLYNPRCQSQFSALQKKGQTPSVALQYFVRRVLDYAAFGVSGACSRNESSQVWRTIFQRQQNIIQPQVSVPIFCVAEKRTDTFSGSAALCWPSTRLRYLRCFGSLLPKRIISRLENNIPETAKHHPTPGVSPNFLRSRKKDRHLQWISDTLFAECWTMLPSVFRELAPEIRKHHQCRPIPSRPSLLRRPGSWRLQLLRS